jgi:hypothetical protein
VKTGEGQVPPQVPGSGSFSVPSCLGAVRHEATGAPWSPAPTPLGLGTVLLARALLAQYRVLGHAEHT